MLVTAGGVKLYSYGFFIALGYLSALALGRFLAKSRGLDPSPFMDLAFIAIVTGVVGSRLMYVLQEPARYLQHPAEIFDVWTGGLVFYGGFLLATVACIAYGTYRKMTFWLSTDIVLASVAFAHAFGRIGCFAAGCCHGNYCPYPWGIHNDTEFVAPALRGQPLHPVQLYESFCLFVLSLTLAWLIYRRVTRPGIVAAGYVMGYAAIRFVLEAFRGDDDRGVVLGGALSTSQGIAAVLFLVGAIILAGRLRRQDL